MLKLCCRCKIEKTTESFNKRKRSKDGLCSYCRDCSIEYFRDYRYANTQHVTETQKEYRVKNKDKIRESKNSYIKERVKTDPIFRMLRNIRLYLRRTCKNNNIRKNFSVTKNLKYSKEELILHLQSLFQPGMTWNNQGSFWHIDHIRPCNSFDVVTYGEKALELMWALENLRPILAEENIAKSDNYRIKETDLYVCPIWAGTTPRR